MVHDGSEHSGRSHDTGEAASLDNHNDEVLKEVENLARTETRYVQVWKLLVVAIILLAGAAVSTFTYMSLSGAEESDYEDAFKLFAGTVGDISTYRVQQLFQAHRDMAESITAYEIDSQENWPFVTFPMFEVHAYHLRALSLAEATSFHPFVRDQDRAGWSNYSVSHQSQLLESQQISLGKGQTLQSDVFVPGDIVPVIFSSDEAYNSFPSVPAEVYSPTWQVSPPPFIPNRIINYDLMKAPGLTDKADALFATKDIVIGRFQDVSGLIGALYTAENHQSFHDLHVTSTINETAAMRPHSWMFTPIFGQLGNTTGELVAMLGATVAYDNYLSDLLPNGVSGVILVLKNNCNDSATYELTGNKAIYLGMGDHHDSKFDDEMVKITFADYDDNQLELMMNTPGSCVHEYYIYPSQAFVDSYTTTYPILFTTIIAAMFLIMAATFFVYDGYVSKRNSKVVDAAAKSTAIVSSLFPSTVRAELTKMYDDKIQKDPKAANKMDLKAFLNNGENEKTLLVAENSDDSDDIVLAGKPLADLFPETTIMFGDLAGFTAWSSVRAPTEVFTLLETLYRAFDATARRHRIFKVETIGDCYVAVCGLPEPNKRHAVAMARFASDCMEQTKVLTRKLEVRLGPDTGDLQLRVGLHSGPVTAGVLRGEKSRFQLFGDTMNTAARMESNGKPGCIQVSQETADCLVEAGKASWIVAREDKIIAKGKGELQTYWLEIKKNGSVATSMRSSTNCFIPYTSMANLNQIQNEDSTVDRKATILASGKGCRLIEWNVDVLLRILKQVVARRNSTIVMPVISEVQEKSVGPTTRRTVLEEVQEIIVLPEFDPKAASQQQDPETIVLDEMVVNQLKDLVTHIAALYKNNYFHNFEHASHVTMSVVKLMKRIIAPSEIECNDKQTVHDHTYGITSDPMTQFACVFSALIHDVDHTGVPNTQLIRENPHLASLYKGKSVAEQNSVDVTWNLLMDDMFEELRNTIFPTEEERLHFRHVVVNSVMATDIMDKDLKELRNARWDKAFSEGAKTESSSMTRNRKATIVIEHLIQASDVAHTMQHWHIYRKWNERLFAEMYTAYKDGRAEKDPSEFWYKGEIGFFDFYIIPLARKLKDCGVFGVSSDEYLNYAERNRKEWEDRGEEIVGQLVEKMQEEYGKLEI